MNAPDKFQPALLGGTFLGVLSALPFISAANLCCCLWVVAGGAIAAYLLQQNQPAPITPGDGAAAGFMAGTIGAVVYALVSIPVTYLLAPVQREMMGRLLERSQDVPPEVEELIRQLEGGVASLAAGFVVMLIFGAIFATLGGFLGALLVRRSAAPPPPPPPPPVLPDSLPPER